MEITIDFALFIVLWGFGTPWWRHFYTFMENNEFAEVIGVGR